MNITTAESLEFELGAELADDSWMEYNNEDCMTDASDPRRIGQRRRTVNTL